LQFKTYYIIREHSKFHKSTLNIERTATSTERALQTNR